MTTKIGFNNFKAFGPKMQYFTKKPITLIYGPNSVGKSSLIRAMLYKEYIKNPNFLDFKIKNKFGYRNLIDITTYDFGDKLNIGSFKTIIHKHNESESLNFNTEYNNIKDITSLISVNSSIDEILSDIIHNYKEKHNSQYFEILSNEIIYFFDNFFEQHDYNEFEKLLAYKLMPLLQNHFVSKFSDNNSLKMLIKIYKRYTLFALKRIEYKKSLVIKNSISNNLINQEPLNKYSFFIDNRIMFSFKLSYKSRFIDNSIEIHDLIIFPNDEIFQQVFFVFDKKLDIDNEYRIKNFSISEFEKLDIFDINASNNENIENLIKFIIWRFVTNSKLINSTYYIGPLRNIPDRKDLEIIKNFYKMQSRKQKLIDKNFFKCFHSIASYFNIIYKTKYLKFLYLPLVFPLNLYCMIKKLVLTFFNSIYIFKYIKSDNRSNLYLWHSIFESKRIRDKVNNWLKDKGKHNSSYRLSNINTNINKIEFFDESTQTYVHPQDMGVGISQSLPIIIASNIFRNRDIFIEQPELHLHPKLQMEIADEFIKSMHTNENNFILETHSEHILLRIMKRMRHTDENIIEDESLKLTPADICLLYVDNNGETTYIKELELDKDGTLLDPWPNGFFEEGYKERFE